MKKNLYYEVIFQRRNFLLELLFAFFFAVASWPRLVLEVFLRRNMGERYFSLFHAVLIFLVLAVYPVVMTWDYGGASLEAVKEYPLWYAFLAAFAYASYRRYQEIKRLPTVFDFERFSLSAGLVHPFFYQVAPGRNIRTISMLLEPGLCFVIGLVLLLLKQPVGALLLGCSFVYSLSYAASYHQGDNFVMDQIDKMICSEELVASFVDGRDASQTRGFEAYGRRPADPEMRRKVADSFFVEDEETVEAR